MECPSFGRSSPPPKSRRTTYGKKTILFVDEIHRFNKAQQDALLPHVENGTVTLIGATTENPSFAVNSALLSRARVFGPQGHSKPEDLRKLLDRALADDAQGVGHVPHTVDDDALAAISQNARGDARRALSALELASDFAQSAGVEAVTVAIVQEALATQTFALRQVRRRALQRHQRLHQIDARQRPRCGGVLADAHARGRGGPSLRPSKDADLRKRRHRQCRPTSARGHRERGRRVSSTRDARGYLPRSRSAVRTSRARRRSNASYKAWKMAQSDVREHGALPVPLKLRNAPTESMKAWGYGEGYRDPHDESGFSRGETYLPDTLVDRRYYRPTDQGFEARIRRAPERTPSGA